MGSGSVIDIKGLSALQANINSLDYKLDRGIEQAMKMILRRSKPLVPVDTGALKKSGRITKIENGYEIRYHAENPKTGYNYAPIQHDNLEFTHRIGQDNYLAQPVQEKLPTIKAMVIGALLK